MHHAHASFAKHTRTQTNTHTCIFPSASASFPSPCTQVAQRRIRIVEHMRDFDKLRKGRVTVRAFRSALSMCNLNLTLPEYRALERVYAAQGVADHVNYTRFRNDVDQVFGNANLERDPTQESTQFIPPMVIEVRANTRKLPSQRREQAEALLRDIAFVSDERGTALEDDFKDYDKVNRGSGLFCFACVAV